MRLLYSIAIIAMLGAIIPVHGQGQVYEAANKAYMAQQFGRAASLYDSLLSEGYEYEELYYNAGNAHYKLGHIGSAILNFERALKLNPGNESAAHNLELARARTVDQLEQQPELFISKWLKDLYRSRNAAQWRRVALWWIWIAFGFGAIFVLLQMKWAKQLGFFGGILAAVLSVSALGLSLARQATDKGRGMAIVMTPAAYIKEAPDGQTDLLILHEGSKLEILDEIGGWRKVRIDAVSTGKVEGFVRSEQVTKI